ncbi:MAG: FUSC family protein [Algibacter sp.]|uniref:FUSC family protein n=1 Tax=Algibacter sp. TaxID=1872428 RepID=UPI00261AF497|nr:FUSC family protein [Algibacter sp.]MDG1729762.1 FUSC family protein [Algibacter sp.]MDG2177916.1 FUSC family protein [Algibacter sp.]
MKKLFTILALIASILAIIFSVLPLSNLAIIPAIAALVFGGMAFYLSKKTGKVKKIIQFIFLLTIMALAITTYKSIFTKTEVTNTETIEATESKLEEQSIEELENLDIEIDDSELEDISFE